MCGKYRGSSRHCRSATLTCSPESAWIEGQLHAAHCSLRAARMGVGAGMGLSWVDRAPFTDLCDKTESHVEHPPSRQERTPHLVVIIRAK